MRREKSILTALKAQFGASFPSEVLAQAILEEAG